jgi:hypothetical protein
MNTCREVIKATLILIAFGSTSATAQSVLGCLKMPSTPSGFHLQNVCEYAITAVWCVQKQGQGCYDQSGGWIFTHVQSIDPGKSHFVMESDMVGRGFVSMDACRGRDVKVSVVSRQLVCESKIAASPPALPQPPLPPTQPSAQSQAPSMGQSRALLQDLVRADIVQPPANADREIRPAFQAALRASRRAFQEDVAGKKSKVHNNASDATQCMKVESTGVREEWGMHGRMRMVNTCGFPVEVSWCANEMECAGGHGSTWTLQGGWDWPIFSTDPANPMVRIAACKTDEFKTPLPSDAALARAGGINARHNDPPPARGVSRMLGHVCE